MSSLQEYWDEQAGGWAAFARTEGHDVAHARLNFPGFLRLLPPPGRTALDVGCGEGRVGAELERRGYRVVGVDSSPRMVELARERHEAVVADATALPFDDGAFDLAIAYMSLMNMDDLEGALPEIARVLEPGGRFCFAVTHPFATAGSFASREPDAPYVVTGSYFAVLAVLYGVRFFLYERWIFSGRSRLRAALRSRRQVWMAARANRTP